MKKVARSFRLTEANIKAIEEHREIMRVGEDSEALRDIIDNAQKYRHWRDLMILKHWQKLESLGLSLDNVRYVIHSLKEGYPGPKMSVERKRKLEHIGKAGEIKV